jgi:hypothetical protein
MKETQIFPIEPELDLPAFHQKEFHDDDQVDEINDNQQDKIDDIDILDIND